MKLTNKKKIVTLFMLFSTVLVLGGWGKKKIELMTNDKLIDLEKAIVMAPLGSTEKKPKSDDTKNKEAKTKKAQSTQAARSVTIKTVKIQIRGTKITIDGAECAEDDLEKQIRSKCTSSDKVKLLDNYAEAHVYHEVDNILSELSESIGFEYDAE